MNWVQRAEDELSSCRPPGVCHCSSACRRAGRQRLQTFRRPQRDLQASRSTIIAFAAAVTESEPAAASFPSASCDSAGRIYLRPARFAGEMQPRPIASRRRRLSASHSLAFSLVRHSRDVGNYNYRAGKAATAGRDPGFMFDLNVSFHGDLFHCCVISFEAFESWG